MDTEGARTLIILVASETPNLSATGPSLMLADGFEPPVLARKRSDLQSLAFASLPY